MSRTLFLPLAVITAVLLAGCGGTSSGTETQAEEEGSYSGEVLSTPKHDLQPFIQTLANVRPASEG